jgi:hypothetical protein
VAIALVQRPATRIAVVRGVVVEHKVATCVMDGSWSRTSTVLLDQAGPSRYS